MKKGIVGLMLLTAGPVGHAAEPATASTRSSEEMSLFFDDEQLVGIATRHLQKIDKAPAIVSVVSGQDIENMGARNLQDVLQRIPGFAITINTFGRYEVAVRGVKKLDSNHVKILVDGHAVNDDYSGGASWIFDSLSLVNVKRIEIIRGPGSALYGANAMAGVINVVTKDAGDIDGVRVTAGFGSHTTTHANLQAGKRFGDLAIASNIDLFHTDGPKLFVASDKFGGSGDTKFDQWRLDAGFKASYQDFTFNTRYINRKRGPYIGVASALGPDSRGDYAQYFTELGYQRQLNKTMHLSAKVYMDKVSRFYNYAQILPASVYPAPGGMIGVPEGMFGGHGAEVAMDYQWTPTNLLTSGMVMENRKAGNVSHHANFDANMTSPTFLFPLGSLQDVSNGGNWLDESKAKRRVWAGYAQNVWQASETLGVTLGVRHDNYSDFGGTTNPRAAAVWQFAKDWDTKLLYATAFRAPAFDELYLTNNPAYVGNPDLKPEKMKTLELSLGHTYQDHTKGRLTYFNNSYQEKIGIISSGLGYQIVNRGGANIQGLELEMQHRFTQGSEIYANATYLDTKDSDSHASLADVAKRMANVGANIVVIPNVSVNANLRATSGTPRALSDARQAVTGYGVMDVAVNVKKLTKGLDVRAVVHNLFDKKYVDAAAMGGVISDYPRDRRTFMLELGYKL
ncbi:MAG: TonB-dependent receptor [Gammaproteobacteria bacterium]